MPLPEAHMPDAHKDAVLATLALAEELAYLIADRDFTILFASPGADKYGVSAQRKLGEGPSWLSAMQHRLANLFDHPSLFSHTAHDAEQTITIQAQVVDIEGVPRLLILLRHCGESVRLNAAPYHAATGLYSAAFVESKIDEELKRIKRFTSTFSLLAIDISPLPHPVSLVGDLLRIHFRAIDTVGHGARHGFLALLPGLALEQARLAGARLGCLAGELHIALPAPIVVRYTAIEALATDTRANLLARLGEAEPLLAHVQP